MLTGIEQFLFGNFKKMPLPVRVFTYLFVLFLFAYLLLVPRFINGAMEVVSKSGGRKPYRAGELHMHVEGRVFKFKVNEEGYWSVPIVSLLPHPVQIKVHHVDADEWFPVDFKWSELWTRDLFQVTITNDPPGVKLLSANTAGAAFLFRALASLRGWVGTNPPAVLAGELQISPKLSVPGDPGMLRMVETEVVRTVSDVTRRNIREIGPTFPLTGASAPRYSERIEIIDTLERKFKLRIPDEHWNYLNNVGELVDYIQKRELYRRSSPRKEPEGSPREPLERERLKPVEPDRPIFKR